MITHAALAMHTLAFIAAVYGTAHFWDSPAYRVWFFTTAAANLLFVVYHTSKIALGEGDYDDGQ